ncbi:MAG: pilus assembly protein PilM [Nitrospinota bacterium]
MARLVSVELEGRYLRAVKIRKGWRRLFLESIYFAELPGDVGDREAWESARDDYQKWSNSGGYTGSVIASLPGHEAISSPLRFPFRRISKIEQVLKAEMESSMPLAVDEAVADFVLSGGKDDNSLEVLAVGAPKIMLADQLDRLAKLGIEPIRIDYSPLSVIKTILAFMPKYRGTVFGALHIGAQHISFSLCDEGSPIYIRTIQRDDEDESKPIIIEGGEVPQTSKNDIDIPFLLTEMKRTIRSCSAYLKNERKVAHIVMTGEGHLPKIAKVIESELQIHCQELSPGLRSYVVLKDQYQSRQLGRVSGAIGAAVNGKKLFGRDFTLRREEFVRQESWRDIRRPILAACVSVGVALFLGYANLTVKVQKEELRLNAVQARIRTMLREVFPKERNVPNSSQRLVAQIQNQSERLNELLGKSHNKNSILEIFSLVNSSIPLSIQLRLNELLVDSQTVSMKGETITYEAVNKIKTILAEKSSLGSPIVKRSKRISGKRGVEFSLQLSLKEKAVE